MIFNLNETTASHFLEETYDVCIIGAGFAGITLALNLDKNLKVLLLEGGDYDFTVESQDIYKGKIIGHDYWRLEDSRARCFGGTSNIWGRWMVPLEDRDFEKKPYAKLSGWPITKKDLDPYLKQTNDMFEMSKAYKPISNTSEWDLALKNPNKDFEGFYIPISPVDFKEKFGSEIKKRKNIFCYLNANLTDMTLIDDLSSLKEIEVRNYKDEIYKVSANRFVLATGGIENARLLLSFNKQCKQGIGNNNDLVGRYFNDHPQFKVGTFILENNIIKAMQSDEYHSEHKFLRPSNLFMKEHSVLNFGIRIETSNFLKEHANPNIFKSKLRKIVCQSEWLTNMLVTYYKDGSRLYCEKPDISKIDDGLLVCNSEQVLNPLSRVILDKEVDKFGMRRSALNWQLTELDKSTVRKGIMAFAKMFASEKLGRVKIDKWVLDENDKFPSMDYGRVGPHHMCTTRMSNTPKEGVVDSNQKVFDIDNLYIAGTSVFSTGGEVNPNFSMVQMTLRLAEHLNISHTS